MTGVYLSIEPVAELEHPPFLLQQKFEHKLDAITIAADFWAQLEPSELEQAKYPDPMDAQVQLVKSKIADLSRDNTDATVLRQKLANWFVGGLFSSVLVPVAKEQASQLELMVNFLDGVVTSVAEVIKRMKAAMAATKEHCCMP